jgi:hypothetical protein
MSANHSEASQTCGDQIRRCIRMTVNGEMAIVVECATTGGPDKKNTISLLGAQLGRSIFNVSHG